MPRRRGESEPTNPPGVTQSEETTASGNFEADTRPLTREDLGLSPEDPGAEAETQNLGRGDIKIPNDVEATVASSRRPTTPNRRAKPRRVTQPLGDAAGEPVTRMVTREPLPDEADTSGRNIGDLLTTKLDMLAADAFVTQPAPRRRTPPKPRAPSRDLPLRDGDAQIPIVRARRGEPLPPTEVELKMPDLMEAKVAAKKTGGKERNPSPSSTKIPDTLPPMREAIPRGESTWVVAPAKKESPPPTPEKEQTFTKETFIAHMAGELNNLGLSKIGAAKLAETIFRQHETAFLRLRADELKIIADSSFNNADTSRGMNVSPNTPAFQISDNERIIHTITAEEAFKAFRGTESEEESASEVPTMQFKAAQTPPPRRREPTQVTEEARRRRAAKRGQAGEKVPVEPPNEDTTESKPPGLLKKTFEWFRMKFGNG